jgi:hypothetical protein
LGDAGINSLRCQVTTISSLSDQRDKTDIVDTGYGLDLINKLRPVEFTWDTRDGTITDKPDLGFIAQEMGREINTLGSKCNHVEIQKQVENMKNELEKIKEQVLNIL